MNVRRSMAILISIFLLGAVLFAIVVSFSAAESRFECDGGFVSDKGKTSATAFAKLHEYRWWVSFWSDSDGALWLEVPNETVEYFGDLQQNGDQMQVRERGELKGSFSLLSKILALKTSRGFYDGTCKRIAS